MVSINYFYQVICKISIFVICAEVLIQLRAREKYEKYLKVCLALMITGVFLGYILDSSGKLTGTPEIHLMEEELQRLREEEIEQAVDLFWERLLLGQGEEGPDVGEREETADQR